MKPNQKIGCGCGLPGIPAWASLLVQLPAVSAFAAYEAVRRLMSDSQPEPAVPDGMAWACDPSIPGDLGSKSIGARAVRPRTLLRRVGTALAAVGAASAVVTPSTAFAAWPLGWLGIVAPQILPAGAAIPVILVPVVAAAAGYGVYKAVEAGVKAASK